MFCLGSAVAAAVLSVIAVHSGRNDEKGGCGCNGGYVRRDGCGCRGNDDRGGCGCGRG